MSMLSIVAVHVSRGYEYVLVVVSQHYLNLLWLVVVIVDSFTPYLVPSIFIKCTAVACFCG